MRNGELLKIKDIDDAAISYMKSIKSYTSLKKDEEHKLIIDYRKNNNLKSRDKLIKSNLKYTCKLASQYRNRGVPFSHLISEANAALLYAIDKFDVNKDTKLMSYAKWWIMQRVDALVEDKSFDFDELPTDKDEQFSENNNYSDEQDSSCDYSNGAFLSEDIETNQKENTEILNSLYRVLNEREIDFVNRYFGRLPYEKGQTLEEIGKVYNISRERTRQIIEKSLTKLRSEAMLEEIKTI